VLGDKLNRQSVSGSGLQLDAKTARNWGPQYSFDDAAAPTDYSLTGTGSVRLGSGGVQAEPTAQELQAAFRQSERDYRQATDTGATSMTYQPDDRGLFGAALRATGGDRQRALAVLGTWSDQGVYATNRNGSPIVQDGQSLPWVDTGSMSADALAQYAQRGAQVLSSNSATMLANAQASSFAWGDRLSLDGSGASFAELAAPGGGASFLGATTSLGGWQRTQAHALGVYDAGAGALESAGYSFGVVGTPESRAAWAVQTAEATVEGIRRFASDLGGTISGWWDDLTGDDPVAIRQATAQGTGIALGIGSGIAMGRLSSGGLTSTGARSLSLAEFERQLLAADRAYGEIRLSTTDIQSIAQNTGLKEFQVMRVKNHLFLDDTHQLSTRVGQFDADLDIANAWRRMEVGTHTFDDIKLFKHEYFESKFEKIFQTSYENAHNAAQKRYPSPLID
jgi:hypothetical protein